MAPNRCRVRGNARSELRISTSRALARSRAIPGAPIAQRPRPGARRSCDQGPVTRASTLRSAVPETLPDGLQHWNAYLRLIADPLLTIDLSPAYHKDRD